MATGRAEVEFDSGALGEIFRAAAAVSAIEAAAWAAVARLRESSPKDTGTLAKSWGARVSTVDGMPTAFVNSSVSYWHIPQFGSAHVNPTRYIDRAMERTGLRNYRPTPKG